MEQEAYRQLVSLIHLFQENGLEELVVEEGSFKVRLGRGRPKARAAASVARTARAAPPKAQSVEVARKDKGRTVAVRSPLIGVFYRAVAGDARPFVEIGDVVAEGQTVCVVEAMKVFNEIKAEWRGRVIAVPAENGKLVQAGDPLVVLEFLGTSPEQKEG